MPRKRSTTKDPIFSLKITVDGTLIKDSINVISVEVDQAINQISHATIFVNEPDSLKYFRRGASIAIEFSYNSMPEEPIFEGLIISHGVSMNNDEPLAIIECYDEAAVLTVEPKSAIYTEMKANEAIEAVINESNAKVEIDAQSTRTALPVMTQYNLTDWDFLTALAVFHNQVLINKNSKLTVVEPKKSRAQAGLALGDNIISIHASVGDVANKNKPEAMGRVESYGNVKASVGDTIRLKGIGSDIDGDNYVSGIKHVAENGTWTTLYDFGVDILQLQQDFDKQDVIPDAEEEQAQLVSMVSESGHSIIVDDEQNTLIIITADGNRILLDDENNSILIEDTNDNSFVMNDDAISIMAGRDLLIEANNKISLSAGDDITIDSQKSITIDASLDAQIKGTNATIDAAASLDLTGNASTNLTSSAQTRITGALVTIN